MLKQAILGTFNRMGSMKYSIKPANGTAQLVHITSAYFKTWHVWNVKFDNGKVVVLFKLGSHWMQRNEDFLDAQLLNSVGACIDKIIFRRKQLSFNT